MRFRDLDAEANAKREYVQRLLSSSTDLELIAEFRSTAAGIVLSRLLESQVENWKGGGAWGPMDDEAKREQGKALRSRELLEYLRSAEEEAQKQLSSSLT